MICVNCAFDWKINWKDIVEKQRVTWVASLCAPNTDSGLWNNYRPQCWRSMRPLYTNVSCTQWRPFLFHFLKKREKIKPLPILLQNSHTMKMPFWLFVFEQKYEKIVLHLRTLSFVLSPPKRFSFRCSYSMSLFSFLSNERKMPNNNLIFYSLESLAFA